MSHGSSQWVSQLKALKDHRFTNRSLPVTFQRHATGQDTAWIWKRSPASSDYTSSQDPFYIQDWSRNEISLFNLYQWTFMAPVFGDGQPFRFKFERGMVLPYIALADSAESKGFFGEVFKVRIHAAHIKTPKLLKYEDGSVAIALKKAKEDRELLEYFDKEAENLQNLRSYKSNHLIKPIAAYQQGEDRCLLFPWAEGGNLAQYWSRKPGPSLPDNERKWVFGQLTGLFGALDELHESNCRHGDLKPENILLFIDADNNQTLQIADMGLSTFHESQAATRIRKAQKLHTLTPPGTSRYEPPETDKDRDKKTHAHETRSRAYDIWSMGCVVLELLIWLAQGFGEMEKFRRETAYFWERAKGKGRGKRYRVGSLTRSRIKTLYAILPVQPAWRELLWLVETRLLVVNVSDNWPISSSDHRETARGAYRKMAEIQRKYYPVTTHAQDELAPSHYYAHGGVNPSLPSHENNLAEFDGLVGIERKATDDLEPKPGRFVAEGNDHEVKARFQEHPSNLNDSWVSLDDNTFASKVFDEVNWDQSRPLFTGTKIFCATCSTASSQALFPSPFKPSDAQLHCDLCGILLEALKRVFDEIPEVVKLRQTCTTVGVEGGPDLLSIYVKPGPSGDADPTRQSDGANPGFELEHNGALQQYIDFDRLPKTFQDAITVTRGLGIDYIWIDTLCIIQGDKDDWENESTKMEEVFSAAYCTISAAAAKSSLDGFLSDRSPSSKAAFLGDANFPQSALEHYKDGRQLLIQDLYERYSALAFTKLSDRAVAILGLQTRLARELDTQAAHGSFEIYFGRSILWKRHQPEDMTAIEQSSLRVPTWSWFSKSGRIQYMSLEFNKIEWVTRDFESPFARHPMLSGASYFSNRDEDHNILRGLARRVDVSEDQTSPQIVFDRENELTAEDLWVVVIGRDKEEEGVDAKAHVLVICKSSRSDSRNVRYERVGVASLPGKQVSKEGVMVDIW
ncbi:heterokaryon incompatibility protein [Colletotrichum plurivorum]|uniref:Heterokaryon incompatibility protein n=1 Tax=Colletotrichum plurivorum TaxID=2175906 RepID=A0A8H6JTV9_9PEZI|nr:heterokaryon incompatibility protein [Colletotrichum plurivorum]